MRCSSPSCCAYVWSCPRGPRWAANKILQIAHRLRFSCNVVCVGKATDAEGWQMAANGTCFVPSLVGTLVIRAGEGCVCLLGTCCCSRKAKLCFQPDCPVYALASRCFKSSIGFCRKQIGFIRDKGSFFCFLAEI